MIIFAAIALAIAAIGFMAYPIVRPTPAEPAEDEGLGELHSKREITYSAIEELKFDYEQGKLSLRDYQDLEKRYKEKAISILKGIDAWEEEGKELKDEIEGEVVRLCRGRRAAAVELVCTRCRGETRRDARFCPSCGSPLSPRCSQCGASYEIGDRFCSRCGESLFQEGGA